MIVFYDYSVGFFEFFLCMINVNYVFVFYDLGCFGFWFKEVEIDYL